METHELVMTALRAAGVYVVMLLVVRALGKRTVGNFSAFDLLVALMLGEVVDEIIYGDVPIAQGAVAILVIAALQYGSEWLSYWDHGFGPLLEGRPTAVVQGGEMVASGLRKERINERDLMAELRHEGIEDIREVKLATVETDGVVTVIREDWAEPLQKGDLDQTESDEATKARGKKKSGKA